MMTLVSTISYIDRNALAQLIPSIRAETGLSAEQYGYVVSAFSVAYMVGNPVWGAVLDALGLRRGMALAVTLWTAASAGHGLAGGFASFLVLRFLLGFGEGATFPGALRAVWQTLPPELRGRGIALAYSGGSFGAILTPLLIIPVALQVGWRGAFWFTGLLGLAWIWSWRRISRRPELAAPTGRTRVAPAIDWRDRRLWGALAAYSMGSVPLGFILYHGALYLVDRFGVTQADLAWLMWIPPLGWEAGYFFWGWMCDRLGLRAVGRILAVAAVLSLPLGWAPALSHLPLLMLQLFGAMFVTGGFIIPSLQHAVRIARPGSTSLVAGLGAGSFSFLIALLAPWFGRQFDHRNYGPAFLVASLFPLAGFVLFAMTNSIKGADRSAAGPATRTAG